MDVSFTPVIRKPLYQFRVKNSQDYRYVTAASLHEASKKLEHMNLVPDVLQYAGELVEENV